MNKITELHEDADARKLGRVEQQNEAAPSEAATAPLLRRRVRPLRLGLLVLAIAALIVFGGRWLASRWSHVSIDDARIAATLVTVSSEVSGEIQAIKVTAGERIAAGELLVTIDPEEAELVVSGTEARMGALGAQTAQLRAQQDMIRAQIASRLAAARAQIAATEATHSAAEAELRNAQSQFDRIATLASRQIATPQDEEDAQGRLDAARQQELATAAAIEAARANLDIIQSEAGQIAVIDHQVTRIASEMTGLQAERAQKLIDLRNREVWAAFDGVVDASFVDQGEYVTPGTRLLIYHRPDEVWVDANVKETDLRRISIGAPVSISVDAYPGRAFRGQVERIGGAATSQFALLPSPNPSGNFTKVTQRVPIRVSIDTEVDVLSPGMMVVLSIDATD